MKVYLSTLGCRLNEAELESWSRDFRALGYDIAGRVEEAGLVVVNSCAVTAEAVRKSRKLMGRARRHNPGARLVVTGCYASLDPAASAAVEGVDLVVENRDKERLVEIVRERLALPVMPPAATPPESHIIPTGGRQRAFIKVQDGCRYQCTFCVVTLARGEERSRPPAEVVAEIDRLHAAGVQEAVLTGVHLGGYGSDIGSDLGELVRQVLERTGIPRLRLGAVEPWDLPAGFWELFRDPRLMPHLHLPLQSGADSVLRRMARRCKAAEFERLVERARRAVPDFNLTTDIIVGFPGETPEEWRQTLELVGRIGFGHLHIFAYSPRPGTRAATMPDPVPRQVIRERSEQLHALGRRLKRETLSRYPGRRFPVLIEGRQ
ncbi:MAG TPA: tRNA (N(6)-L-threonylcarbamoyladenosine(37)-C(2))-methylthiotransferase MtaB, partial [Sedimenticola thiotaurini]|nr:tRNA (N(6)-L-threonylcarbamoyladenosine(37)-C(2))-methylthiotransferase MtaB [Sedimenticola thiotaurini]